MAFSELYGLGLELSMLLVAYTWIAYPLLLAAMRWSALRALGGRISPPSAASGHQDAATPSVSIIVPVHNEESRIAEKLRNCLEFEYPHDHVEFIVCSDGSTDATEEIVLDFIARDARIRWLQSQHRAGKSGVQNIAAAAARGDILFFTDANARMNPGILRVLIDALADPAVGLVTGTVHLGEPEDAVARGQGFYWRYELFLRVAESDLGILATASGQAMAVRRELYRPLPPCYGDDCILPLDIRMQGRRVVQERSAIVFDTMPHSIQGELRARIRMTARNWAGTLARPALLNPLRFPFTAWGLVSHKLLRWLTPFFLVFAFLSNTGLALSGHGTFWWWLQAGFYLSAFVGWQLTRKQRSAGPFGYSFSFCLANVGFLLGMLKAFRNQKIVAY
jgi:cellulose synthase/poly-beta-1,6-N-acetylglucosamine synthase-like glycosyltransferase